VIYVAESAVGVSVQISQNATVLLATVSACQRSVSVLLRSCKPADAGFEVRGVD